MTTTNTEKNTETKALDFNANIMPVARELGLQYKELKNFHKLSSPDGSKAVYVSKTKRRITRVDISGFEVKHPAIKAPVAKNGKVTGQVNVSHPKALGAIMKSLKVLVNGEVLGTKRVPKENIVAGLFAQFAQ